MTKVTEDYADDALGWFNHCGLLSENRCKLLVYSHRTQAHEFYLLS